MNRETQAAKGNSRGWLNTLFRAVLSNFPDGVLVVDEDWHMVYFNRRFVEMWEIPEEIQRLRNDRQSIETVLDKLEDPEAFIEKVVYLHNHRDICSWDELKLKDGRVYERFTTPLTNASGEYIGRVWFFRDITPRIKLAQQHMALKEHVRQLEKQDSLRTFAASLSHHINNLLFGIAGNIELANFALDRNDPDCTKKHLKKAMDSTGKAVAFCRKLIYYLGPKDLIYLNISIGDLIRDVASQLLNGNKDSVKVEILEKKPNLNVIGDETLLKESVKNLLLNAIEATDGRGRITVTLSTISCREIQDAQPNHECNSNTPGNCKFIEVKIQDNGRGLRPEFHHKVFDPFFSTKAFGRGMGLSTVLGIVKAHNGMMRFQAKEGMGATVSLFLPAHPGEGFKHDKGSNHA